jgi:apolipoprotein N-acyltransferase
MRKETAIKTALASLTSVLLIFSFPNFLEPGVDYHTSILIWVAFVPLFYIWLGIKKTKGGFFLPFISAMIFYTGSLYWLCLVGPMGAAAYPACIAVCAYFSFIIAMSFYLSALLEEKTGISVIFSLPALLTVTEFAREWLISGWPILTPAQSQHNFTQLMLLLRFTGVPGANFIIYSVNMAFAAIIAGEIKKFAAWENKLWIFICAALVLITFIPRESYGQESKKITVAVLQRNIDQNVPWTTEYRRSVMEVSREMARRAAYYKPVLYVWPETAYPGILNIEPAGALETASWDPNAFNLIGSDTAVTSSAVSKTDYYNGAYMISRDGKITGYYAKHHLVPFGEYIPFQDVIPFVRKVVQRYGYEGFKPGKEVAPFEFSGMSVGPLICFDSFFPEIASAQARGGAQFLSHLSYESWYGESPASAQIFTNAALRSAECSLYLVRCVESGISGVVDDTGRIVLHTGLFTKELFSYDLNIANKPHITFYSAHGDWFAWFLLIAVLSAAALKWKKR